MFKNILLPFILCNFATSTLQNKDYNDIYHINISKERNESV